ncbi:MAG: FAD-dependent oxidoreductase [Oscillospiraceae bacterium]|nr:FAD-dependent oxidoreductase [Oscillospiraceae bacterium]MBQ2158355.1 FAD-dependent oxidoreductase [Oscillospiraceae bacterium]MBQ2329575.1 FAD-dependent oxidoreductase [Oscillospiraceae bacterium]
MYDVIVIGGGPAGMTAALYALRNGKTALVIEKAGFGGQITHSPKVENYPGTLSMSGNEFADRTLDQILHQGAEIEIETVVSLRDEGDKKVVVTEEGGEYEGKTVVIATGVKHRMLGLEGEDELVGEGISFCAVCDGDFYAGRKVCVAGGGNSALQEAMLLSEKCSEVIMLQDLPYFTGEGRLQDVLFSRPNVKKRTGVKITSLITEGGELRGVRISGEDGEEEISCDGLFVAIGLIPENEPFRDFADLNGWGYFDSDERCLTKTPGVFVAGDCRSKGVRQLTTAVADGATAALAACRYINEN